MRSLKRNVAKNRMRLMGYRHINKMFKRSDWRDIGAPDYVKRLERKYKAKKAETKEEN